MSDESARRAELRAFLKSRRARIRPEDVGLATGGRRRVPGLRREEVAALAGMGLTWYTMFETGTAAGVSSDVIDSVARALRLSPGERMHLEGLANRISWHTTDLLIDGRVLEALHRWIDAPAYVITHAWDVLAWNDAYSFVWGIEKPESAPFNMILRYFVDERMRALHGESWPAFARGLVAMFRVTWGRHLADDRYHAILDTLQEDPEFAALWDSHDVEHPLADLTATIESPGIGPFTYDVLNLQHLASERQTLVVQLPRGVHADRVRTMLKALT